MINQYCIKRTLCPQLHYAKYYCQVCLVVAQCTVFFTTLLVYTICNPGITKPQLRKNFAIHLLAVFPSMIYWYKTKRLQDNRSLEQDELHSQHVPTSC